MEVSPIIKEVAKDCNLRCGYCFFDKQSRERKRISEEVANLLIQEVCNCNSDGEEIVFYWHGGEPLLAGIDFYRKMVQLQAESKKPQQKVINCLETNATLLRKEWARFFKENEFKIGVSLDGPKEFHDRFRIYPDGRGSFDDVMRGVGALKEEGLDFSVICVVTQKSVASPTKIFEFFNSNKISTLINFPPALAIETGQGLSFGASVNVSSYVDFLIKLFDLWVEAGEEKLQILPIESITKAFLGIPHDDCRFAGECKKSIVVEYNGDIFACNTYGYGDFFKFGNIKDGLKNLLNQNLNRKHKEYLDFLRKIKSKCVSCGWYGICKGGCPGWYYAGKGRNILCKEIQHLFLHIQKRLASFGLIKGD